MASGAEMAKRPEKSSFSITCNLLSQYIKEKGSLADLGLAVPTRPLDSGPLEKTTPTIMSLLPGVDVSGEDFVKDEKSARNVKKSMELFTEAAGFGPSSPPVETKEPEKAQLTIFYGGKVLVFDNFPAEKAGDLMQLASKGQNFTSGTQISGVTPLANLMNCPSAANPRPASFPPRAQPSLSDLPIARKASLHRFLEKRKDRISAKAPYQLNSSGGSMNSAPVKEEEIGQRPWLGLGQLISKG